MAIGTRSIGTRTIGDSAPVDPIVPLEDSGPAEELFAEIQFSGSGTIIQARVTSNAQVAYFGTSDLTPTATRTVNWSYVAFNGRGRMNASPSYDATGKRRVIIVETNGEPIAELDKAIVSPIVYELNKPETWSFSLPSDDPKLRFITDEKIREVQYWRGDQLLSWGPMVRPQVSEREITVSVSGAMWHLGRRHIGKAERTNYVLNGDFEDGLTNWTFITNEVIKELGWDNAQESPPNHLIANFPTITGVRSLKMENTVANADAFASQSFLWEVEPSLSPDGDKWMLVGYVYVESFNAEAFEGRGLYLERFSTTQLNPDPVVQSITPGAPLSLEHVYVPLDEDIPVGVWTRMEIGLTAPVTGEPEIINVRLYPPKGVCFYDRISLTLDERTAYYAVDQALIAKGIVEHLQDPEYDKTDVNITTDCPPTGIKRDRIYYHSEHPNGLRSIEEFTSLSDGFDISMFYTPTERVFKTHYPQKGKYLGRFALETRRNISSFSWTFDGEAAATSVIVLGTGSGSGREEGAAIDTSNFAGLTLEEVFVAPPDSKIESLDNIAIERLATTTAPEVLAITTTPARGGQRDPIGVLSVGDTVPVKIESGAFSINDIYRVTRLSINPNDSLDLVLNRREFDEQ